MKCTNFLSVLQGSHHVSTISCELQDIFPQILSSTLNICSMNNQYYTFCYLIKLKNIGHVYWVLLKSDCLRSPHTHDTPWGIEHTLRTYKFLLVNWKLLVFDKQNWKYLTISWLFISFQWFIEYLLWVWHCSRNQDQSKLTTSFIYSSEWVSFHFFHPRASLLELAACYALARSICIVCWTD